MIKPEKQLNRTTPFFDKKIPTLIFKMTINNVKVKDGSPDFQEDFQPDHILRVFGPVNESFILQVLKDKISEYAEFISSLQVNFSQRIVIESSCGNCSEDWIDLYSETINVQTEKVEEDFDDEDFEEGLEEDFDDEGLEEDNEEDFDDEGFEEDFDKGLDEEDFDKDLEEEDSEEENQVLDEIQDFLSKFSVQETKTIVKLLKALSQ